MLQWIVQTHRIFPNKIAVLSLKFECRPNNNYNKMYFFYSAIPTGSLLMALYKLKQNKIKKYPYVIDKNIYMHIKRYKI